MYKTIFNKRNSLKFNRFSNKNYSLFAVLGREVLVGALSVATLSHAKAAGVSTEGAKVDSTLYKGGKAYELDAVSVTGSRAPMTVEQSPKIVSVITRDDIHRAAAQTINDVLKLATGVDVRQRGGFGVQTDISINGGTFDQITILLNGVNISNPQTGHNASDFPVALADIDPIDVLEGAGIVTRTRSDGDGRRCYVRLNRPALVGLLPAPDGVVGEGDRLFGLGGGHRGHVDSFLKPGWVDVRSVPD